MDKMIGKNTNMTDAVKLSQVYSIDSNTAVDVVPASLPDDDLVMKIDVTNDGNKALRVRFRSASADNIKDEMRISPGETETIVRDSEIYTGPISAIFEAGGFRDVSVVVL